MKNHVEYLLKYISNDAYQNLLKKKGYQIEEIAQNRRDVELNIRYLIRLGVKNVDYVVIERIDDLLLSHHDFIKKINQYLDKTSKEDFVNMLENS
ncbi:MAG: hypothetical protein SO108_01290 [Bacilli bacterium]|nr:hypothetical protein [Bacilli bacterium]